MIKKIQKYIGKSWEKINDGSLHSYDVFCDLSTKEFVIMNGDQFEKFWAQNKTRIKRLAFSNICIHLLYNNSYQMSAFPNKMAGVFSCEGAKNILVLI